MSTALSVAKLWKTAIINIEHSNVKMLSHRIHKLNIGLHSKHGAAEKQCLGFVDVANMTMNDHIILNISRTIFINISYRYHYVYSQCWAVT